jgi:hypothetical protein
MGNRNRMWPARIWQASDRTGGSIDDVFAALRRDVPDLLIERLATTHPGDDDNVYFLGTQTHTDLVQIDTAYNGWPPFVVEAAERLDTSEPDQVVAAVRTWFLAQLAFRTASQE